MVAMWFYFKFKRVYEGKVRYHISTQKFRGSTRRFCKWCADGFIEDMVDMGWEVVEQRLERISYFGGD